MITAIVTIGVAGCTSAGAEPVDADAYRAELIAGCTAAQLAREALAEPAEPADVVPFANAVSKILEVQADSARGLRVPDDLDGDHRTFVQNTADQAARWAELAATAPTDTEQFGSVQNQILELALGRDDLAVTMGVPQCSVSNS